MSIPKLSHDFNIFCQEGFLSKKTILSGFDNLLNANYNDNQKGNFYSAFFLISIGIERMLKIALICEHMIDNNYNKTTSNKLKAIGHDIHKQIEDLYGINNEDINNNDLSIVQFLSEYNLKSRYYNLDNLCNSQNTEDPIEKWKKLSTSIFDEYTSISTRKKRMSYVYSRFEKNHIKNNYIRDHRTGEMSTKIDLIYHDYINKRSAHLAIWRIIQILKPVYSRFVEISKKASQYEIKHDIQNMTIPHFEEFFEFLLSDRSSIMKRTCWSRLF